MLLYGFDTRMLAIHVLLSGQMIHILLFGQMVVPRERASGGIWNAREVDMYLWRTKIFSELNLLNMSMQKKTETHFFVPEKFKAFKAILRMWKERRLIMGKLRPLHAWAFFFSSGRGQRLLTFGSKKFYSWAPWEVKRRFWQLYSGWRWVRMPFKVLVEDLPRRRAFHPKSANEARRGIIW